MESIDTRLKRLEYIAQKYKKPTALFIIEDLEHQYHINNFKDMEIITSDLDKYYKDNNIDTSDKDTHITIIQTCNNRTIQDVLD